MKNVLILVIMCFAMVSHAEQPKETLHALQLGWEKANYQTDSGQKESAFSKLVEQSNIAHKRYPDSAEILIWDGIIKSTYAGVKGGLGALSLAKEARKSLERAISLNGEALHGSAYTSLGVLYSKVPGWPIGFGSDKKAADLLQKGLAENPEGIDSNYFYAEYLSEKGKKQMAREYYLRAQNAPMRPGRELADIGRQNEIRQALEKMQVN